MTQPVGDGVLGALQLPDVLPVGALVEALAPVAVRGEERHVFGVDQRADDLGQVSIPRAERVGGPQHGHTGEVRVAAQRVGQ